MKLKEDWRSLKPNFFFFVHNKPQTLRRQAQHCQIILAHTKVDKRSKNPILSLSYDETRNYCVNNKIISQNSKRTSLFPSLSLTYVIDVFGGLLPTGRKEVLSNSRRSDRKWRLFA